MSAQTALRMEADNSLRINWESLDTWTRNQLQQVIEYCDHHRWIIRHISDGQSRMLQPILCVWQITFESHLKLKTAWIVTGDLPTDVIPFHNVPSAREALLHFSKKFINKAHFIRRREPDPHLSARELQNEKCHLQKLVKAAADLLVLFHEDKIWE